MQVATVDRIRGNLQEKRQALERWFAVAPPEERQMRLGSAGERQFADHLHVIDGVIARAGDGTFGICDICHLDVGEQHLEMDYTASVCIDHFTEPEVRQLEREIELAQTVQRALLPQVIPSIPGLQLAAFSRPAQFVGGDIFDFVQYRDGAYGLAVADVAGHGISAGLIMAGLQTALRTAVPASLDPQEVLAELQRIYQHNVNLTLFITLILGRFETKGRRFSYVSAGHNPPLLIDQAGGITWLAPTGPAIGLVEGAQYRMASCQLQVGDVIVFYTDGVTELMNPSGQMFGEVQLAATIASQYRQPAPQILGALRQSIEAFAGGKPLLDDATIVICRVMA